MALLLPLAACAAGADPPERARPDPGGGGTAAAPGGGSTATGGVANTSGAPSGGTGALGTGAGSGGGSNAGGAGTGGRSTGGGGAGGTAGASGGALFADDFESPDYTAAEWFPNGPAADWSIVSDTSNVYQQGSLSNVLRISSAGDAGWADQAIEVKVKLLEFGGQGSSYLAGVFARVQSVEDFYYVALREDGKLAIRARVQGENGTLGSAVDAGIALDTWYTVKLEVIGTTLNAYLDGALLVTASDASIPLGAVGVGTINATARFDDVRVTQP